MTMSVAAKNFDNAISSDVPSTFLPFMKMNLCLCETIIATYLC